MEFRRQTRAPFFYSANFSDLLRKIEQILRNETVVAAPPPPPPTSAEETSETPPPQKAVFPPPGQLESPFHRFAKTCGFDAKSECAPSSRFAEFASPADRTNGSRRCQQIRRLALAIRRRPREQPPPTIGGLQTAAAASRASNQRARLFDNFGWRSLFSSLYRFSCSLACSFLALFCSIAAPRFNKRIITKGGGDKKATFCRLPNFFPNKKTQRL